MELAEQFQRTRFLIGSKGIEHLQKARVAVFGVGGVGGFVVESLVRSGIGEIDLIDNDTVSLSNLNRQIIATRSTIGKYKVDVMKERILDINPEVIVHTHRCFFLPETASQFDFSKYSYVIDAIDTVTGKIQIIEQAKKANVPVISAMGAGNKLDPTKFVVTDIYKTSICPLAKVMRKELRKRGIDSLKVVYSTEEALTPNYDGEQELNAGGKRAVPGSIAFVPSVAGLILAGEVVKDLIKYE